MPSTRLRSLLDTSSEHLNALDAVVSGIAAVRDQISHLQAAETLLLQSGNLIAESIAHAEHHSDHGEMAHRMVAAEIGASVHESDRTVAIRMDRAATIIEQYPLIFSALASGSISLAHATVIADAGLVINDEHDRTRYAATALEYAETESVGRLRPIVKQLAEQFAERTREERHEEARACRMVRVIDADDGMADLIATLPAAYAYGIKDRLDRVAHHLKAAARDNNPNTAHDAGWHDAGSHDASWHDSDGSRGSSGSDSRRVEPRLTEPSSIEPRLTEPRLPDSRTVDQIRADLLTDLLLASDVSEISRAGTTGIASIHARVQVIVPIEQLTSPSAQSRQPGDRARTTPQGDPASLAGYGPIDTETAQRLAGHASSWERIIVDGEHGRIITTDAYRPSAELKRFLGARDQHCRFPGCRVPLRKCDIDHTVDAALGGPTSSNNLAHICRRHHTLKHATPWKVTQDDAGVLTWISPTGRMHQDLPTSRVRFRSTPGCGSDPSDAERRIPGESIPTA